MKNSLAFFLCGFLSCFASPCYAQDPPLEMADLNKAQLVKLVPQLQSGGFVFYIRHAATDQTQTDSQPVDLSDCSKQRNLSKTGIQQAKEIGEFFTHHGIPVGRVHSSPFCRCKDTAKLAFGHFEENDALYFAISLPRQQKEFKAMQLRLLLGDNKTKGNTILVSHTSNLKEATGIWPKPEGATYLFKPDNQGAYTVIGRIAPELWTLSANRP